MYRIVRGVIQDVSNAHPQWRLDPDMTTSVSKRIAGTLRGLGVGFKYDATTEANQKADRVVKRRYRRNKRFGSSPVLHFLGVEAGSARKHGNIEREKAMVDVLKFIGPRKKRRRYMST